MTVSNVLRGRVGQMADETRDHRTVPAALMPGRTVRVPAREAN